jgi:hypothetical protein
MRRLALLISIALLAAMTIASPPVAADTPHAVYSCFEIDSGSVYNVHKLSQCRYGRITIYSTYDTKIHGHIYVENGLAYKPISWSQFCKVVLHLSETVASRTFWKKVWAAGKKFYNDSKVDDPDLPIEPVP